MTITAPPTADTAPPAAWGAWAVPGVGVRSSRSDDGSGGESSSHPIVVALTTCVTALESVRGVSATTLSPKEIRLMLLAVVQVVTAAFALKLRLLVAGEVQRVCDLTGARSTAAFLAHLTHIKHAHAASEVRLAKDLDSRFPLLTEALEGGAMSPEHVRVAVAALRKLPKDLDVDQWEACQRFLVDAAQHVSPQQLKAAGRRLWEIVDPEGADEKEGKDLEDEEELARAKACFKSWSNGDGTTSFKGRLPDLQASILIKAIQAFASPRRRSNPNIPTSQPDDVRHQGAPEAAEESGEGPPAGDPPPDGEADGFDPDDTESPEERQTGRSIPYPVRLGHGLMDLLERLPRDLLPDSGGVSALIRLTMPFEQLRRAVGSAHLDPGLDVSAGQARRLACNAGIIPVVLGGKSEPLDVGRTRRLHTKPMREALEVRDEECVAEGCSIPAAWTEAHHLHAWEDGGSTNVEDGCLVCPYHHRLLHSSRWKARWVEGRLRFRRLPV